MASPRLPAPPPGASPRRVAQTTTRSAPCACYGVIPYSISVTSSSPPRSVEAR
jgi:hypothetical protein